MASKLSPVPLGLILAILVPIQPSAQPFVPQWQKGITFSRTKGADLGSSRATDSLYYLKRNIGVEWVALHPAGYQPTWNMPFVSKDDDPPDDQVRLLIRHAHHLGLKVMLKPHVQLTRRDNGAWRGKIEMPDDESWKLWFAAYQRFILHYARLAAQEEVDLFCIGTELAATTQRQTPWRQVIARVREHYSGPLVYAAHWDNFDRIGFWDALDYIGINAYFPLSDAAPPTAAALERRARQLADYISLLHQRTNKPVLLTEVGFKSVQGTSLEPWQWHSGRETKARPARTGPLLPGSTAGLFVPSVVLRHVLVALVQQHGHRPRPPNRFYPPGQRGRNHLGPLVPTDFAQSV